MCLELEKAEMTDCLSVECEFNLGYFVQSFRNEAFKCKAIVTAILGLYGERMLCSSKWWIVRLVENEYTLQRDTRTGLNVLNMNKLNSALTVPCWLQFCKCSISLWLLIFKELHRDVNQHIQMLICLTGSASQLMLSKNTALQVIMS